jgi:hypothetical protein
LLQASCTTTEGVSAVKNLVHDNEHDLVGEQGLDAMEKLDLVADGVPTLLGN